MKIHLLPLSVLLVSAGGMASPVFGQIAPPAAPPRGVPVEIPAGATESPAVLRASEVLIPQLVASPLHRVRELVPTDGYLAHFTVDTEFGTFAVAGSAQLGTFLGELQAISRLSSLSRSDLFADGLKRSIEQPVDAARNVITHPVETVKALPSTVGHFFKRVGNTVGSITNRAEETNSNAGNQTDTTAQDIGRTIGSAGKGIIGFETAKLDCARQLGVDPYTDNPRLQEEIGKVAWVFFAGGLPMKAAGLATGAGLAVSATKVAGLPDEVYSLTPGELSLRNNQNMTALGVAESDMQAFNNNPALTPTLRRSILARLTDLNRAAGRAQAVALASNCATRQQARFYDQALRILVRRQASGGAAITEIKIFGRLPAAVDATGALLLPMASDYVSWTPETAAFVTRDDLAGLRPQVLHTGMFSPMAAAELTRRGWVMVQL